MRDFLTDGIREKLLSMKLLCTHNFGGAKLVRPVFEQHGETVPDLPPLNIDRFERALRKDLILTNFGESLSRVS